MPPFYENVLFWRDLFAVAYMPVIFAGWLFIVRRVVDGKIGRGRGTGLVLAWCAVVMALRLSR